MGKFDGVTHQIEQHLTQSGFVQHHCHRHFGMNADLKRNALLGRSQVKYMPHITEQAAHGNGRVVQPHFACLNAGKVKDIVDQHQQAATACTNSVKVIPLLGVCHRVAEQIAVANDRIHRRAYLVGHIGKEFTLCQAGCLSLPRQALRFQFGCSELVFTSAQGVFRADSLVHLTRQLAVPVQEDQHHDDGDQHNPAHHGVIGFLLDIQMDPAVVDRLGFRCIQATQGLVQNSVQFRPVLVDRETQLVFIGGDAGNPQVGKPQAGHRVTHCRDVRDHYIQIPIG